MVNQDEMVIPPAWHTLPIGDWQGPILVLGASDSGKSTFARYVYTRLVEHCERVGFLDADVGQNSFGLPATLTLAVNRGIWDVCFPPGGSRRVSFVGSNTPHGVMLAVVLGLERLRRFARRMNVNALVIDTSGLVDPLHGGAELKWAKVALFRPCMVVALAREQELEPLIAPLRYLPDVCLVELPAWDGVRPRTMEMRRAYRAACYRAYFAAAPRVPLPYGHLAVFPDRDFIAGRLAALEGRDGFALALALIESANEAVVWLRTPWTAQERVAALRMGNLRLDLETFQDIHL